MNSTRQRFRIFGVLTVALVTGLTIGLNLATNQGWTWQCTTYLAVGTIAMGMVLSVFR